MRDYHDDAPESSDPWEERWTISTPDDSAYWDDATQWVREALDCRSFPLPEEFDLCPSGLHKMGSCSCDDAPVCEDYPF